MLRRRRLLGNLLDQPVHPLLLLLLGGGQQQQVLGCRHVVVHWRWKKKLVFIHLNPNEGHGRFVRYNYAEKLNTFAGSDDLLLLVHVVLVALDVAAPALQSRRRLKHVPQRLGARFTVGGEVVECGDELMAFVADVAGLLTDGKRFHRKLRLFFALTFIGVKNLAEPQMLVGHFHPFKPLRS